MGIEVAVHASGELVFEGEAELATDSDSEAGWSLVFAVPAAQVAQLQMRRGERVYVALPGHSLPRPALIRGVRLDDDAGFSGISGLGYVELAGEGPAPD